MRTDATKLALAVAVAFAMVWLICSVMVWVFPGQMMRMSSHMVHGDLSGMSWQLSGQGFFIGLLGWSASAGFIAWLAAVVYGRLGKQGKNRN